MNDIAMKPPVAARREIPHTVSPGLWTLAWRRLKTDRVAMVSLAIVAAFIAADDPVGRSASSRKDWAREIGVNYAPPSFVGAGPAPAAPAADEQGRRARGAVGPDARQRVQVDGRRSDRRRHRRVQGRRASPRPGRAAAGRTAASSIRSADVMKEIEAQKDARRRRGRRKSVDPLADVMKDIEAGKGAPQAAVGDDGDERRATLPFGADKWGRDVIAKTIKGSETSIFVGLAAALVATFIGTVLGALAGYYGRWVDDVLNWFYSVFSSIPYLLLILAVAAVLQQKGTMTIVLILGPHRLDRRVPPDPRRVPEAQGARVRAGGRRDRRVERAPDVRAHLPQRVARRARAAVDPRRRLHQVRGDPVVPGLRRAGRRRVVGLDAERGAERADPRQVVAARRRGRRDGDARHRVLALHRRAARRARSEAQGHRRAQ